MLAPGGTIGILGGGQLGRMLALAAAELGYRCHIFAPEDDPPAAAVSAAHTRADYGDAAAMTAFAAAVDVITLEWENVDCAAVRHLAGLKPVHPGAHSLEVAQDRMAEKQFVEWLGGRTAPWAQVDSRAGLDAAIAQLGLPAILKTRRFGYDGKGQARILAAGDADAAWEAIGGQPAILEAMVDFAHEYSVILCRAADGTMVDWPVPVNVHKGGILATSSLPAPALVRRQAAEAAALARTVAEKLGHVGVLTCEFFACRDGLRFNEMAPRVHNSGHWTIEGSHTSQFENHVRAVVGLPLRPTGLVAPRVTMTNLIGDDVADWPRLLADPDAHVHLYGKGEARPGRKMGHVTRLG
ncbi:5-(carboxyamino)imidazole ribonucleotide synthase [Sandarakinorhabdus rubra]|uniref:5-(carboxyamino)imidazole ribonucleotide synthase n=1 Tax=Sandarakinorhabdus rubra TaxID=2672568 RepID=UPI0013D90D0D|nr:5-(carboxyamino)imidazole ribonucleotide synthase [Sandarakinorhabdus rubra]